MLIFGHRGASGRLPENTLPALRGAIEDGADGVEFDVRATVDGVPVLLHDRDLRRTTTGTRAVAEVTLAELRAMRAHDEEPVPTLAEALAAVGDRLRFDIEIKQPGIEAAVLDLLRRHPGREHFVSSFDWECLRRARRLDPSVPIWPLAMACDDALLAVAAELDAPGVALAASGVDSDAVARLQTAGLAFAVWTVNDVAEAKRMAEVGATILVTDEPAAIRRGLLEETAAASPVPPPRHRPARPRGPLRSGRRSRWAGGRTRGAACPRGHRAAAWSCAGREDHPCRRRHHSRPLPYPDHRGRFTRARIRVRTALTEGARPVVAPRTDAEDEREKACSSI